MMTFYVIETRGAMIDNSAGYGARYVRRYVTRRVRQHCYYRKDVIDITYEILIDDVLCALRYARRGAARYVDDVVDFAAAR